MSERQRQERLLDRIQAGGLALSAAIAVVVVLASHSALPMVAWMAGVIGGMWFAFIQARIEDLWRSDGRRARKENDD